MNGLIDYVRWVADNMGIKLDDSDLNKLTIELINCDKYKEALNELQGKIVEVSDSNYFEQEKEPN